MAGRQRSSWLPARQRRGRGPNHRRRTELGLLLFTSLIVVGAYVLASIGTTSKVPPDLGAFLAIVLLLALVAHVATRLYAPDANPVLLPLAALLNGLGYAMLARLDPQLARLQAAWTAISMVAYVLTLVFVRHSRDLDRYRYLLLLGAVALMLAPLVPHIGVDEGGVRLWIKIGPVTGEPVELAKIALAVFFASYFTEKRELLSIATLRVGNRLVLDPRPMAPILVAWGFCMLVLGAERDVGFAMLLFVLFVGMLWLGTGRLLWLAFGAVLFAIGAVAAVHLFPQVHERVTGWLDPWPYATQQIGDQIVQGMYAFGSGGLIGTGLGYGLVHYIPEVTTDYIFAAFGEEMGLLGTTIIVFAFVLFVGAGMRIAQKARSEFAKMTAAGLTLILGMQAFFIMAGIVRLLPLTGITLPFIAYGGSSLVGNYILVGLLMRLSDEGDRSRSAEAVSKPTAPVGAVSEAN
ncbi:MAG TPA: FtsW/RodA/SpoVE family cell cycle protein [Acidimicrobiales bacterium]|nr:FtsW/RodA/SpoVE family cell cycle protein [Acidimicrobiales bacterium]